MDHSLPQPAQELKAAAKAKYEQLMAKSPTVAFDCSELLEPQRLLDVLDIAATKHGGNVHARTKSLPLDFLLVFTRSSCCRGSDIHQHEPQLPAASACCCAGETASQIPFSETLRSVGQCWAGQWRCSYHREGACRRGCTIFFFIAHESARCMTPFFRGPRVC